MDLNIRLETPADYAAVENLTREAFWNVHVPGADEHYLVHIMRDTAGFVPALDFVAERDGALAGNIMYTKAHVEDAQGARHEVLVIGPLSVLPACQRQGVGRALVAHSAQAARALGYRAIFLYGDPLYYGRLGFLPASDFGVTPPDGTPHAALQVMPLYPGALEGIHGRLYDDPIFAALTPEAVAEFDARFPPREKGFAESQRRFSELSGHPLDV